MVRERNGVTLIKKAISYLLGRANRFYRCKILREPRAIAIRKWLKDDGDNTLRVNYPLTDNSVVFDVGGHHGEWAKMISEKYNPFIYVFEPIPEYCRVIEKYFGSNAKVSVHNFGLSDKDKLCEISVDGSSSSFHKEGGNKLSVHVLDIFGFLEDGEIDKIDLVKINIEGGEYELISRMIDKGIVPRCEHIQIQFHRFYPNAEKKREQIRSHLNKTHRITYDYPFVWENWSRR